MALLWRRLTIASPLPLDEAQQRLAASMLAWRGDLRGRVPPAPPWKNGRFSACAGAQSFWLGVPLVVTGTALPQDGGTLVSVIIRPHGFDVAVMLGLAAMFLPAIARSGALALALTGIAFWWAAATCVLWLNLAWKAPGIAEVLASACGKPGHPARSAALP